MKLNTGQILKNLIYKSGNLNKKNKTHFHEIDIRKKKKNTKLKNK